MQPDPFFAPMTWRGDGTLNNYAVTRSGTGAWNESRAYGYNSRGQLLSEGFSPAAGLSDTLTYVFDGSTTRLGVRTDAKAGTGAPGAWEASATAIDTLARVTQDQINAAARVLAASGVALGADHVDVSVDGVSQGRAVHPGWADPVGAWSMNLNLAAGSHTLTVNAEHPSHQYTATASSTFTVAQNQGSNVTSAYDADGDVTSRTWDSGLAQTLTWDAFGRLIKVAQRDSASNGYDWSAIYDGLGRRLETTQQAVTADVASGAATVTTSIYDPQVEFLEIGVAVNGAKAWKVYGPDLNDRYGSLQGTGGLEATIVQSSGATKGVINDQFGNGVASVSGGQTAWFTTRVGAYGPLPGSQIETLTDITRVAEATAWRSRRVDSTGFIYLGARYYEPTSGRFFSADPLGHAASMSLYDYANGDPVNYFDPDGRLGKTTKEENPDCAGLRRRLAQAQSIERRNEGYFRPGGQYASGVNGTLDDIQRISLTGTAGGLGTSIGSEYVRHLPTQTAYDLGHGITGYKNVVGQARVVGGVALGVGIASTTMETVVLVDALQRGDSAGALLSGGNVAYSVAGLALGGPIGITLGGAQLLVNGTLYFYQQHADAQDYNNTLNSQQASRTTIQRAKAQISKISQEMAEKGCQ